MGTKARLTVALALATALAASATHAGPLENIAAATAGADRLVATQFDDGSFPWVVGDGNTYQNVQGITGVGLLEAYKVSLNPEYLAAAKRLRDWHEAYRNGDVDDYYSTAFEIPPPRRFSAGSYFFLAEYALLSRNLDDLAFARAVLLHQFVARGGAQGLADLILNSRASSPWTNLGIWDVALFIRAAQDVGFTELADELADALVTSEIVDPFDSGAGAYELGLAGLLFGLAESDLLGHGELILQAEAALRAAQAGDGSVPLTYAGEVYAGDVQGTAYAAVGFQAVGSVDAAMAAADFLVTMQKEDGSFMLDPETDSTEIAEVNSEAIMGLVAASVPVPQGVLNYADVARGYLE